MQTEGQAPSPKKWIEPAVQESFAERSLPLLYRCYCSSEPMSYVALVALVSICIPAAASAEIIACNMYCALLMLCIDAACSMCWFSCISFRALNRISSYAFSMYFRFAFTLALLVVIIPPSFNGILYNRRMFFIVITKKTIFPDLVVVLLLEQRAQAFPIFPAAPSAPIPGFRCFMILAQTSPGGSLRRQGAMLPK